MTDLASLTYAAGYDLGRSDAINRMPRQARRPRTSSASAGRFGYCDGYDDGVTYHNELQSVANRVASLLDGFGEDR